MISNSKTMEVSMIIAIVFSTLLMLLEHSYSSWPGRLWATVGEYMRFNAFLAVGQIVRFEMIY